MIKAVCLRVILAVILVITACTGCGKDKEWTSIELEEIERISVTFDNAEGITNTVVVDLAEENKKTILYSDEKVENEEAFEADEAFSEFIRDTVLKHISGEKDSGNEDTMRVVWRIQVLVGEESIQMNGFEGFPEYWEELLAYIGEK